MTTKTYNGETITDEYLISKIPEIYALVPVEEIQDISHRYKQLNQLFNIGASALWKLNRTVAMKLIIVSTDVDTIHSRPVRFRGKYALLIFKREKHNGHELWSEALMEEIDGLTEDLVHNGLNVRDLCDTELNKMKNVIVLLHRMMENVLLPILDKYGNYMEPLRVPEGFWTLTAIYDVILEKMLEKRG